MKTHKKRLHVTLGVMTVVAALVVLIASYALWFAYHSARVADTSLKSANKVSSDVPKQPPITTFKACKTAPRSKMLLTYPEQCITAAGKTFTDTTQSRFLMIKEWNVKIPLSVNINDATYLVDSRFPNVAVLSLKRLDATGCSVRKGTLGEISRFTKSTMDVATGASMISEFPTATQVGSYYYVYHIPQAYCDSEGMLPDFSFSTEFSSAVESVQAN